MARAPAGTTSYLDNLKVVLVAGVIAVHVAITYGMHGSWYLASYDRVAPALRDLLTAIGAVGWLFGMGLFLLVAGWLSVPSLDRKGVRSSSAIASCGSACRSSSTRSSSARSSNTRAFAARAEARPSGRSSRTRSGDSTPGCVASFAIRLALPLGSEQFHLRLPVFPQYVMLFAFGVAAARRGWLGNLPRSLTRRCGFAALAAILLLPLVLAAGGFFSGNKDAFAGGWHWQALAAAAMEGTLASTVASFGLAIVLMRSRLVRRLIGTQPAARSRRSSDRRAVRPRARGARSELPQPEVLLPRI
jgi:hypothetical protein